MDALPRNRLTAAFERRVARALERGVSGMSPVIVACSGGADSSATLIAVARSGLPVTAAHFNHRLRSPDEAEADRVAVAALAARLGVPLVCGAGSGVSAAENAAREERYRWLATAAVDAGSAHVVTGHTLDDQAETVLLRLTRGSGLTGAAGMAEDSPWPVGGGGQLRLVRPLLGIERREVEAYLQTLGVEPRHDPTNDNPAYARNRIRHRVLPELAALNPQVARALATFAARAARDDEALEAWAAAAYIDLAAVAAGRVILDRRAIRALPPAVRVRILRHAAAHCGTALLASQADAIERAIRRAGSTIVLPGARLHVSRMHVVMECTNAAVDEPPEEG